MSEKKNYYIWNGKAYLRECKAPKGTYRAVCGCPSDLIGYFDTVPEPEDCVQFLKEYKCTSCAPERHFEYQEGMRCLRCYDEATHLGWDQINKQFVPTCECHAAIDNVMPFTEFPGLEDAITFQKTGIYEISIGADEHPRTITLPAPQTGMEFHFYKDDDPTPLIVTREGSEIIGDDEPKHEEEPPPKPPAVYLDATQRMQHIKGCPQWRWPNDKFCSCHRVVSEFRITTKYMTMGEEVEYCERQPELIEPFRVSWDSNYD